MMNKYLTIFGSHSQYVEPEVSPNVSYCIQEDEVHYCPVSTFTAYFVTLEEQQTVRIIGGYNLSGTRYAPKDSIEKVVIDDTITIMVDDLDVVQNLYCTYTFEESGEHTVKYFLKPQSAGITPVYMFLDTNANITYIKFDKTIQRLNVTSIGSNQIEFERIEAPTINGYLYNGGGTIFAPTNGIGYEELMEHFPDYTLVK